MTKWYKKCFKKRAHSVPPACHCELMFSETKDACAIKREDFGDSLSHGLV